MVVAAIAKSEQLAVEKRKGLKGGKVLGNSYCFGKQVINVECKEKRNMIRTMPRNYLSSNMNMLKVHEQGKVDLSRPKVILFIQCCSNQD